MSGFDMVTSSYSPQPAWFAKNQSTTSEKGTPSIHAIPYFIDPSGHLRSKADAGYVRAIATPVRSEGIFAAAINVVSYAYGRSGLSLAPSRGWDFYSRLTLRCAVPIVAAGTGSLQSEPMAPSTSDVCCSTGVKADPIMWDRSVARPVTKRDLMVAEFTGN